MTQRLLFSNPGEIDPKFITTFGVNVKETASPIGFFGTGLKYAIAGLIRLGQEITVFSGERRLDFRAKTTLMRGKEFSVITMNGRGLGFTTELGKNWEPWQFYRELYCNALDENGGVAEVDSALAGVPGETRIYVTGTELMSVHSQRGSWFLQSEPLERVGDVEIHPGGGDKVFFRGIFVGKFFPPAKYTYNITDGVVLTEDRTCRNLYEMEMKVKRTLMQVRKHDIIRTALTAKPETLEGNFNWNTDVVPSAEFVEVLGEQLSAKGLMINQSLQSLAVRLGTIEDETRTPVQLTPVQSKILAKAELFLKQLGFELQCETIVVESLGVEILGMYENGKCYVSKLAFERGTKCVAGTILEENLHHRGFYDCTRAFQNFLLDKLMSFGEELLGEPL